MIDPPVVRIPAPSRAPEPARPGFPLAATLAPVVGSGVLFAVTGSPFMLLMAGLGPLVALASLADGARHRRRARRTEAVRYEADLATARDRVTIAQDSERARRASLAALDPRWSEPLVLPLVLALGRGRVPSGVEFGGDDPELETLCVVAAALDDAPVLADVTSGIAITGPPTASVSVARLLVLRLAARLSPSFARVEAPPGEEWARALPHEVVEGAPGRFTVVAARPDGDLAIRVGVGATGSAGAVRVDATRADGASAARARLAAERLASAARVAGLRGPGTGLPEAATLAELLTETPGPGLAAPIGRDADGLVTLDLATQGPHAVVAGTTGSGKSELLVSWVLGMAAGRTPDEVSFVLVDFKGGAAFAPLAGLPHVLGILSDLDDRLARRAILSLRAEVLRRERALADAGARSIEELAPGVLARLVVVVDEVAALLAEQPELHALFADLAARGRSLGVHLVLCTQRPSGVVRDAVLANVALRIALRVADRGDSLGLLGDDSAARLPLSPRGRAVVADGSGTSRLVQVALASRADADAVAARSPAGRVSRPWCDPLPALVPFATLPATDEGLAFGLCDLPAEQRQPAAVLAPRHGHLLVLGAPGAGATTTLAALAAADPLGAAWLPSDPVELWSVLADPRLLATPALLLADDLDRVLAACPPDHVLELTELVARLLRDGPRAGVRVVAAARRPAGAIAGLVPLFGSRLLLRMPSREEYVLAGGEGSAFDPRAVPGAGTWEGSAVQVASPEPAPRRERRAPAPPVVDPTARPTAVVSGRPRDLIERWGAARVRLLGEPDGLVEPDRPVLLGDPDAWQADWAELSRARRELPIVLHACGTADLRAIIRSREVPPPLGPGEVWLVEDGEVRRATLA